MEISHGWLIIYAPTPVQAALKSGGVLEIDACEGTCPQLIRQACALRYRMAGEHCSASGKITVHFQTAKYHGRVL